MVVPVHNPGGNPPGGAILSQWNATARAVFLSLNLSTPFPCVTSYEVFSSAGAVSLTSKLHEFPLTARVPDEFEVSERKPQSVPVLAV
jgi:hypothetical protein